MPGTVVLGECLSCTNILLLAHLTEAPRKSCGGKLVPCVLVVEVAPASSKLPADVDLRIPTGERHGFATSGLD